jgi:leader peptidase (prepilin peptidase)/N-methyltransferase
VSPAETALAGALGAVLGSFANVVIYRLPRGDSIVVPGSRCPNCQTPIRPWDNIPLISYLILRGRCRACGAPIAARYPMVEGLMAVLTIAVRARFVEPAAFLGTLLFVFLLLAITFIDLDHQIIPHWLSQPGIVAGLILAGLQHRLVPAALAGLGAAGFILAIYLASLLLLRREGMGLGDVWLAALMGVFLGWPAIASALFLGILVGGVVALLLLALGLRGRKDAIPFGPALAAGAVGGLFWGEAIARWYWRY